MKETKYFPDGYIYSDDIGMLITLAPSQYANNDIYSYQKIITWHEQAIGHRYDTDYMYVCDKCGMRHEFDNYFNGGK